MNRSPVEANTEEYDIVIIPGGEAFGRMRIKEGLVGIVKEAHQKEKVITAYATVSRR